MTGPRSCRICGPAAPRPRAAISTSHPIRAGCGLPGRPHPAFCHLRGLSPAPGTGGSRATRTRGHGWVPAGAEDLPSTRPRGDGLAVNGAEVAYHRVESAGASGCGDRERPARIPEACQRARAAGFFQAQNVSSPRQRRLSHGYARPAFTAMNDPRPGGWKGVAARGGWKEGKWRRGARRRARGEWEERRRPHGVQEKSAAMLTHAAPRLFANDGLQVVSTARRRRRPGASPR